MFLLLCLSLITHGKIYQFLHLSILVALEIFLVHHINSAIRIFNKYLLKKYITENKKKDLEKNG